MTDGVTTRHQKESQQFQKDLEKLDAKLDCSIAQLRSEMQAMGSDLRQLFEQMMGKMESKSGGTIRAESG